MRYPYQNLILLENQLYELEVRTALITTIHSLSHVHTGNFTFPGFLEERLMKEGI